MNQTTQAIDASSATQDQVIAAFRRFMSGPDAERALRLIPMSKLDAFMDMTMGSKLVQTFIALERWPAAPDGSKPKWLTALNVAAREIDAREQRKLDADMLECFLAVLVQYLVDEEIGYGYDLIVENKYGGTGVFNGGVSIRCMELSHADRWHAIRAIRLVASLFDSRLSSMLELEAVEFEQDGHEDYSIHINFSDLTMTKADQDLVVAAAFGLDDAFFKD